MRTKINKILVPYLYIIIYIYIDVANDFIFAFLRHFYVSRCIYTFTA